MVAKLIDMIHLIIANILLHQFTIFNVLMDNAMIPIYMLQVIGICLITIRIWFNEFIIYNMLINDQMVKNSHFNFGVYINGNSKWNTSTISTININDSNFRITGNSNNSLWNIFPTWLDIIVTI